ncbi:MAG: aspartyl protease family protein [Rikenella sp.]|nr:aspartyl protease family protein [Rikenella sp.]
MRRLYSLLGVLFWVAGSVQARQNDSTFTIPMDYDRYLYLHVVLADSVTGRFLFDLGAQTTLLNSGWVARHGLRFERTQTATLLGSGNRRVKAVYTPDTLAFRAGGYRYASSPNVVASLGERMPGVDGLLGATLFQDRIFRIDYGAGNLAVLPQEAIDTLVEERYERIPFTVDGRNYIVFPLTVVLDSTRQRMVSGSVYVDTGNPGFLSLHAAGRQARRWRRMTHGKRYALQIPELGVGGGGRVGVMRTEALRIGRVELPVGEVVVQEESLAADPRQIGAVGNGWLSRFGQVIFDMRTRTIYLPRIAPDSVASVPVCYAGFRLSRVDRWFVNGISHRTAELRNGDIVLRIDGRPIDTLSESERNGYFCTPDRRYTLTVLRDGATREVSVINLNDKTLWH